MSVCVCMYIYFFFFLDNQLLKRADPFKNRFNWILSNTHSFAVIEATLAQIT